MFKEKILKKPLLVIIIVLLATGGFYEIYKYWAFSNRHLINLIHPKTGEPLSVLVLSSISTDFSYLIRGDYNSLEIPVDEKFVLIEGFYGIGYNDSSWIIYNGGIVKTNNESFNQQLIIKNIQSSTTVSDTIIFSNGF